MQLKPKIDQNANPNTALLVIDVQQGLFEKTTPIYQADALLGRINSLTAAAHVAGIPIIFVQHENDSFLRAETASWELHQRLEHNPDDQYVRKSHGNAFKQTDLKVLLDGWRVGTLIICGLVTHGCVKSSCQGALELGYRVKLVQDGHSSFSKDAPELIEKWNEALADAGVELVTAEQAQGSMTDINVRTCEGLTDYSATKRLLPPKQQLNESLQ